MNSLITELVRYQDAQKLSNKELADLLGVDISYLSRLKRGERRPGNKVLGAMREIPELRQALYYVTMGQRSADRHRSIFARIQKAIDRWLDKLMGFRKRG